MNPLDFLALSLAAWRLAYLLTKEAAPFNMMARIRARTTLGGLLECLYCASIWTAVLCYVLLLTPLAPLVYIAGISGAALMLWRYTGGEHT